MVKLNGEIMVRTWILTHLKRPRRRSSSNIPLPYNRTLDLHHTFPPQSPKIRKSRLVGLLHQSKSKSHAAALELSVPQMNGLDHQNTFITRLVSKSATVCSLLTLRNVDLLHLTHKCATSKCFMRPFLFVCGGCVPRIDHQQKIRCVVMRSPLLLMQCMWQSLSGTWVASCFLSFFFCFWLLRGRIRTFPSAGPASRSVSSSSGSSLIGTSSPSINPSNSQFTSPSLASVSGILNETPSS